MQLIKCRYNPKLTQLEELARRVKAFKLWWKTVGRAGFWLLRGHGGYAAYNHDKKRFE